MSFDFGEINKTLEIAQKGLIHKIEGDHFSERDTELIVDFVKNPKRDKLNVIVAPTGSGKTYSFLKVIAKKHDMKILFVVPYKSLVEGIAEQYEVEIALGRKGYKLDRFGRNGANIPNVVVTTVDQLRHIQKDLDRWKDHTIIMDEYHKYIESSSFKPKVISVMDKVATFDNFKSVVAITATPDSVELMRKDKINKIIFEFKKDPKTRKIYQIEVAKKKKDYSSILRLINESIEEGEIAIVYNNTSKVANKLLSECIEGGISINADTKNTEDYKHLISTHKFRDNVRVCFSTDVITAGVDIKDPRVKAVFILWETMPSTVVQFSGRARLSNEIDIYVVNTFEVNYGQDGIEDLDEFYEQTKDNIMGTVKRIREDGVNSSYFKEKIMERYFVRDGEEIYLSQALVQLELVNKQNSINPFLWKKKFKEKVERKYIEHDELDPIDKKLEGEEEDEEMEEKIKELVDLIEENVENLALRKRSFLDTIEDPKYRKQISKAYELYEKTDYLELKDIAYMVLDSDRALQLCMATAKVVRGIGNVGTAHMYNEMKNLRKFDIVTSESVLARKHGWAKLKKYLRASWYLEVIQEKNRKSYKLLSPRHDIKYLLHGQDNIDKKVKEYKKIFFEGGKD